MKFVRLNHRILQKLKDQGFKIIRSSDKSNPDDPTWYPEKVSNLWDYLAVLGPEERVLIIDEALEKIDDSAFVGMVLVD